MAPDGLSVLDDGKEIVRDPAALPTLEGPKLYKRNGYYYIFAPFGGVSTGSQVVLRSKSIYGPYDHRVVLQQGGYVETPSGQGWFLHFQSRGAHGRIDHLEPVRWEDDWPIIGDAPAGATAGQPVATDPIPDHPGKPSTQHPQTQRPQTSDEFTASKLGPQWEWNHNPDDTHWSLTERRGYLRLKPGFAADLLAARNTLTQTMQDNAFDFTARLDLSGMKDSDHAGIAMFEQSPSGLQIVQTAGVRSLSFFPARDSTTAPTPLSSSTIQLRVHIDGDTATYFYSLDDGHTFQPIASPTRIAFSWWMGARPSLFTYTTLQTADPGHIDFDWAHYTPLAQSAP
jgi:beta-xylosidase